MAKYTAQDLANINSLISGGIDQAMIAGEMVKYRSLSDLRRIQSLIEADLASAAKPAMPVRYPSTSRGV